MSEPTAPRLDRLAERASLLRRLRAYFDELGFLEVQPPCLSQVCVVDAYLDPIPVESKSLRLATELPGQMFLQTSPEAAMKRMLAAGAPSIYSLGPVFRAGESGRLHNVEFTMLEWYEVGADLQAGIERLGDLVAQVLPSDGYDVVGYRQLFEDTFGWDPLRVDLGVLVDQVNQIDSDLAVSIAPDRDLLLDVILSERIQPNLGTRRPCIVKHYPLSQAALARPVDDDPHCAARFELFFAGVELANGYDELRDADVMVRRARAANEKRIRAGRAALPVENALIDAIRGGLPACAGVALGVDRLLMLQTGETSIAKVIPFPAESA